MGYTLTEIRTFQLEDNTISPVLNAKESPVSHQYSTGTRRLFQMWDQLVVENGILLRLFVTSTGDEPAAKQLVASKCLHNNVIDSLHAGVSGGHLGKDKMLNKLKTRFYWPGHYQDIEYWCCTCVQCATRKTPVPHLKGPLQSITTGTPMQLVAVDFLGPFPISPWETNTYSFTKWAEAYPVANMEAVTVAY